MPNEGMWSAFNVGSTVVPLRPPAADDPASVRFMLSDLARSDLLPADLDAYAMAPDRGVAAYVIPYPQDGMYRVKRDDKQYKYRAPQGRNEVWWSSRQVYSTFRSAPLLLIVEGEKKAARAVKEWPNVPVLAIGGVWNGTTKQADGTHRLHETILNAVSPGQQIGIIFDNDILEKEDLQKAAHILYSLLDRQACRPSIFVPPQGTKGLDDYLLHRVQVKAEPKSFEEVGLVQIPFEELKPTRDSLIKELGLDVNQDGGILNHRSNYARLFKKFVGPTIKYDRRLGFISTVGKRVDWNAIRLDFVTYIESSLKLKFLDVGGEHATQMFVKDCSVDILVDEIKAVKWDGVPRLATWGAEHIPNSRNAPQFSAEWGRLLMTGLGLRLLEPGTKFDHVLFLVGPQGTYKTTFFEKLATFKCARFYSTIDKISPDDSAMRTLGAKLRRNIIVDFSESSVLDGRQTSIEHLKSFITKTEDEFREVYVNAITQLPRSFVFVGTSNKHHQLYDTTGSRRWFMLDVKDVVQPLEYAEKMQILAEVFATAEQIKATEWWEPQMKWDELAADIVQEFEEQGFVPNPNLSEGSQIQEAFNLKHLKEDPNTEEFKVMLEDPDANFAVVNTMSDVYATTISQLMEDLDLTKRDAATFVKRLMDNPHFPWRVWYGPTMALANFDFPKDMPTYAFGGTGLSKQVRPVLLARK